MAALPPFLSASRPESTWKGAPRLACPTKLKSTALSVAGASGAAVCALAMPPAAKDRSTDAKPRRAIRLLADARSIEQTPLISFVALKADTRLCGSDLPVDAVTRKQSLLCCLSEIALVSAS